MKSAQINILSGLASVSTTGAAIDVNQAVSASFQVVTADTTAAGTVKLQMSNDIPTSPRPNFTPTNWSDIPSATSTVVAGVGPSFIIANMAYSYIRAVFTRTAGAAVIIQVNMNVLSA